VRVIAATDKFRGTASAAEVAASVARAVAGMGGQCDQAPVADGAEGTLAALGGPTRSSLVMGPLGDPVDAPWRLRGGTAVIEMALASGLALAGGADGNDPIAATSHGTGELIANALDAGARRIIVGMGGSATTDGGLGAVRAIWGVSRLRGVELIAACDVRTTFVDAARVFAPQKGATPAQVALLTRRLSRLVDVYREDFGVDVAPLIGGGAAGGLGGGLAAAGAELVSGFDLVADELGLAERIDAADVVITGEGFLDEESFDGKVVGGVVSLAGQLDRPVLAVVGEVLDGVTLPPGLRVVSLVEHCGRTAALEETGPAIEEAVRAGLAELVG
jgi:glycerate kinase